MLQSAHEKILGARVLKAVQHEAENIVRVRQVFHDTLLERLQHVFLICRCILFVHAHLHIEIRRGQCAHFLHDPQQAARSHLAPQVHAYVQCIDNITVHEGIHEKHVVHDVLRQPRLRHRTHL